MKEPISLVTCEDCMDLMARYPDKYFDLAIVDPPYGIGYDLIQAESAGTYRTQNGGTWKQYHKTDWDNAIPPKKYFEELKRISADQIIWGGNFFGMEPSKCWIIWDKIQRDNRADGEMAWSSFDSPMRIFRYSRADAYINDCDAKIHPTQKPVKLYDWLLGNYAEGCRTILDTHLGSGSSRIAAHKAGFDFVGCEIDKDYFAAQEKRFQDYLKQIKLDFH